MFGDPVIAAFETKELGFLRLLLRWDCGEVNYDQVEYSADQCLKLPGAAGQAHAATAHAPAAWMREARFARLHAPYPRWCEQRPVVQPRWRILQWVCHCGSAYDVLLDSPNAVAQLVCAALCCSVAAVAWYS